MIDVIDLADLHGRVASSGPACLGRITTATCPVVPGSKRGDLCTMHGGPWTSASISAAGEWETRRRGKIRALGCDTCGDGSITVWANAHALSGGEATTRVGPVGTQESRHDEFAAIENPDGERPA